MSLRSWRSRRYRRPFVGPLFWLVLVALLAAIRLFVFSPSKEPGQLVEGAHRVRYVIDGDTLVLQNDARVRLQGIDTPELARDGQPAEPYAIEARQFAETFVNESDGQLDLTFSVERLDRYGRHLAFVWSGETMLNEELVRQGLAMARPDYRFSGKMKRRLMAAQAEAQSAGRGIWSETKP